MKKSCATRQQSACCSSKLLDPNFLPAELIGMVMKSLKPTEVANFRLLCRSVAKVGKEYLAQCVHLRLTPKSFDRLENISYHSIFSKGVKEILFDADSLPTFPDQKRWEERTRHVMRYHKLVPWDKRDLTVRHPFPESRRSVPAYLSHCYRAYERLVTEQQPIRESSYFAGRIAQALRSFPNVRAMTMSVQGMYQAPIEGMVKRSFGCLIAPVDGDGYLIPTGALQTRALLIGAFQARSRLTTFRAGSVSWRFLKQDQLTTAYMHQSMRTLENMDFVIISTTLCSTLFGGDGGRQGMSDREQGAHFLRGGALSSLVSAAPLLRTLSVAFGDFFLRKMVDFSSVVGTGHWKLLAKVSFSNVTAKDQDLIQFCNSHAGTLKKMSLKDITLTNSDWRSALQRMRRILSLDTFEMKGYIFDHRGIFWQMPDHDFYGTTNLISEYLQTKSPGDITLEEYYERRKKGEIGEPLIGPRNRDGSELQNPS